MGHIHGLEYVQHLTYLGMFVSVALSGYAIPIPEEIILILGGFLAAQHLSHLSLVIIVAVLGAICGDNFIYYLSGHGSRFTKRYHNHLERTHAGWYIRQMKNNTFWTIFLSRFIIGFRFLNPLVSGLLNVPWWEFFVASALSALVYIPCIILIGFYFQGQIHMVLALAESIRHFLIISLSIGSAILLFLFVTNLLEKDK